MSSRYKIYKNTQKGYYTFTTDTNIRYCCSFVASNGENSVYGLKLNGRVFNLNVFIEGEESTKRDAKTGATISYLMNKVINRNENSFVSYICDNKDEKAHIRQRCFRQWFTLHNIKKDKIMLCGSVDNAIYAGVILHSKNPEYNKLETFFRRELNEVLEEDQRKSGEITILI